MADQSSQYYMNQVQNQMPDFRGQIAQAYADPVVKPLAQEAGDLNSKWLPTIFNTFTGANAGTGAGDMSAAAKMAMIGSNLGRLGGQITTNRNVQDFYGKTVDNLANTAQNSWQQSNANNMQLAQMAQQRELAQQQIAAQRAAAAAANQAVAFPNAPAGMPGVAGAAVGAPQNNYSMNGQYIDKSTAEAGVLKNLQSLWTSGTRDFNDPRFKVILGQVQALGYQPQQVLQQLGYIR